MNAFIYTFSDGLEIQVALKHSAKKNIIIRPRTLTSLQISVPPHLNDRKLAAWMRNNELLLRRQLLRAQPVQENVMPNDIWLGGNKIALNVHDQKQVMHRNESICLPDLAWPQQQIYLRRFLQQRAAERLLPMLLQRAEIMKLQPAAVALSSAKTFWGVCRRTTGIRLNWRLIGAPEFVADYVCVHELCHLPHPNHSAEFWEMVNQHTPHTAAAKLWLKQNGRDLFVAG